MITTILLTIVYGFVNGLIFLFSALGPIASNDPINNGIAMISGYISPLNNILPIDTIVQILVFELVFETAYLSYKFIRWAYIKIPGVS